MHSHVEDRGLLKVRFARNVHTIEKRSRVPKGKPVEAHGALHRSGCTDRKMSPDVAEIRGLIQEEGIQMCRGGGLVLRRVCECALPSFPDPCLFPQPLPRPVI